ncbi:MAG: hemin receptor [Anaerolineae bacterium]
MNAQEIALVQHSFVRLTPLIGVADLFYARLFQLEPALHPLFKNDLLEQKQKWCADLEWMLIRMTQPDTPPDVEAPESCPAREGGQQGHDDPTAAAWLWTLEQTLGEEFTPEVKAAWMALYHLLP